LESKASALACRSKAEALDSSRPASRLAGTIKAHTATQIGLAEADQGLAPGQHCPILRCMTGSEFIHPR
jgi:hypothetical protein